MLEDRGWVDVIGHRDVPGRPALLATTRQFLDDLGLSSLDELPPLQQVGQENLPGGPENAMQEMEQNLQASLDQAAIDFSGAEGEAGEAVPVSVAQADDLAGAGADELSVASADAGAGEDQPAADGLAVPVSGDSKETVAVDAGQTADEQNADEQNADEQNADEQNADEQNAGEQHADEQHADEQHADEQHADEQHGDGSNTVAPEDIQPEAEDDRSQSP